MQILIADDDTKLKKILMEDVIGMSDLPSDMAKAPRSTTRRLEDMECAHILKVLDECGVTEDDLGISNKLLGYGAVK